MSQMEIEQAEMQAASRSAALNQSIGELIDRVHVTKVNAKRNMYQIGNTFLLVGCIAGLFWATKKMFEK